jgi:hypothetical protein
MVVCVLQRRKPLRLEEWEQVIDAHPEWLRRRRARRGLNPFTREPMTFFPNPGEAHLHVVSPWIPAEFDEDSGELVFLGVEDLRGPRLTRIIPKIAQELGARARRIRIRPSPKRPSRTPMSSSAKKPATKPVKKRPSASLVGLRRRRGTR